MSPPENLVLLVPVEEREDIGLVDTGKTARGQGGQDVRVRRAGGRWQHSPPGHAEVWRMVVSRPRNQRECSYGTPNVIAKPRSRLWSTKAVHQ